METIAFPRTRSCDQTSACAVVALSNQTNKYEANELFGQRLSAIAVESNL